MPRGRRSRSRLCLGSPLQLLPRSHRRGRPPGLLRRGQSQVQCKLSWADDQVADESPIPIIIYSYPAVSSGIVLSTDLTKKLASHPNIVGIKHTDHEVGRIAREVAFGDFGSESLRAPTGSLLQLTASSIYHLGWRFRLPHRDTGCRWSRCHLGHGEYHPSRTGQDLRPLPVGQAGRGPQACRSHLALRMGHRQRWHARDQGEVF